MLQYQNRSVVFLGKHAQIFWVVSSFMNKECKIGASLRDV